MAKNEAKFQITAAVIEFGERVVAMRQVTFAACRRGYPFRWPGAVMLLVALAGIGWEAWLGNGLAALKSGGSSRLWAAFVLAGVAVFALVYQRRLLVIGLSDGSKIRLRGGSNEFQERVVACIGEALRTPLPAPFHATIDMQAQTIEAGRGPGAAVFTGEPRVATGPPAGAPRTRQPAAAPLANGHADPARSLPHERPAGIPPGYVHNGHAPHDAPANSGAPGAAAGEAMPRIVPQQAGSRPVREPSNPLRDMEALVDFVRRSDVQHKTALIELLAVVEDYLKGGSTVRDDAVAHWQSFAGYAHQYLAAVDGLLPLTDRAGRPFAVH